VVHQQDIHSIALSELEERNYNEDRAVGLRQGIRLNVQVCEPEAVSRELSGHHYLRFTEHERF